METIKTKEKIVREALRLFAMQGYDGTGMEELSDAVGIKAPSVYKHFSGKEEIFRAVIEKAEALLASLVETMDFSEMPVGEERAWIAKEQKRMTLLLSDGDAQAARRFLNREQYRDVAVGTLRERLFESVVVHYAEAFAALPINRSLGEEEIFALARAFVSSLRLLVEQADGGLCKERELLEAVATHVRSFYRILRSMMQGSGSSGRTPVGKSLPVSLM